MAHMGRCPCLTPILRSWWSLVGRCSHPIRPCLLGYFSQWTLLARVGRFPRLPPSRRYWCILHGEVFPSSALARMRGPAPPSESSVLMGPAMSLGVLPLSDSESADPVIPTMIQYSSIIELVGPLGPWKHKFRCSTNTPNPCPFRRIQSWSRAPNCNGYRI